MTIDEYDDLVRSTFTLFRVHILRLQLAEEMTPFESLSISEWGEQLSVFLEETFETLDTDNEGC